MDDSGYVDWIHALDIALNLEADIFMPAHGRMSDDPRESRQALVRFRRPWWMRATPFRERWREGQQKIRLRLRSCFPSTKTCLDTNSKGRLLCGGLIET